MESPPGPLSERHLVLLEALREAEREGRPIDVRALARRARFTEAQLRALFARRLQGAVVVRGDQAEWIARGAIACSEEAFARCMGQGPSPSSDPLASEESWRDYLRKVLVEGQRRRYRLSPEEWTLLEALRPEPPPRPRSEEEPIQPSLFRRPG